MPPSHSSSSVSHTHERPEELSARARLWLHTRDPRALWPALDPNLLQPSADAIGRAVSSILRDQATNLGSPRGDDAYAIGIAALLSGTGPLLGHYVENGMLDVSDPLATILSRHLAQSRLRIERIAREVTPALSALFVAGLVPLVIKGFHTAHAYFVEPGLRPISDVDVVVRPSEIGRAESALRDAGFVPSHFTAKPYKRNWDPPGENERLWSLELFHARDRWRLDLHDGPSFGELPHLGLRLDAGLHSSNSWQVDGVPTRTPAQPFLTAILAAHLSTELHIRCLLRVVELVFVIRRDSDLGLLDWHGLEALLDESGGTRFVYPALSLAEQVAPGTVDPAFLSRARRASTPLARAVTARITPTYPILDDRPILAERLMWTTTPKHALKSVVDWINPIPDGSWREMVSLYHSRAVRLLAGRASWMAGGKRR